MSTVLDVVSPTASDKGPSKHSRSPRPRSRNLIPTALGIASALLLAECALIPWSTLLTPFNVRPVSEDSLAAPVLTIRSYEEGIATSHFTPSSARLTGQPTIPGAPYVLIVGDSFVAAEQVSDRQTMGAQLQQIAATQGEPINVRQYGWIAAAPSKYILEAPELRAKWNPTLTVVILNADDFVPQALVDGWATMHIADNDKVAISRVDPRAQSKIRPLIADTASRSALLTALLETYSEGIGPSLRNFVHSLHPPSVQAAAKAPHADSDPTPSMQQIVHASLEGMRRAYGDSLLLLYVSEPRFENIPDPMEDTLLANCGQMGLDCHSMRGELTAARDSCRFLGLGFPNSQPGYGHLNAQGHRLVALEIAKHLPAANLPPAPEQK